MSQNYCVCVAASFALYHVPCWLLSGLLSSHERIKVCRPSRQVVTETVPDATCARTCVKVSSSVSNGQGTSPLLCYDDTSTVRK